MTPAIETAKQAGIEHNIYQYEHDPRSASFGQEAANRLAIPVERVFKTLLVALNADPKFLAVGVVPVGSSLDLKAIAKACGVKKATLAEPAQAERTTGYLVGGISPLGQKRLLPTVIDVTAQEFETVFVSAGRRGLEMELSPTDLGHLLPARFASVRRD